MTDKVQQYWNLNPSRFRFPESIALSRQIGETGAKPFTLVLTLRESLSEFASRASLHCHGVCGLKVGELDGLRALLFEITDIGDRQLEGVKYQFLESENTCLEFLCSDFEFNVSGAPGQLPTMAP